ncbi:larval cuticle protein 1-like [Pararge aegeria]|uniref:larval cuticle protein 1-like n=1 Tax=Pararge aegeria TaxID=116150 RepID=UPI0019D296CB|nr:larval cuticle protein 1-like [Pararge aegeria]
MKVIIVALAFVAVAAAAAVDYVQPQVIRSESDQSPDGSYSYSFESDDGTKRQETAEVKQALDEEGKPQNVLFVRGFYSYIDNEGNVQEIRYVADDQGFHPEGPSIPKPVSRR